MANPIIVIMSVVGVLGVGATASAVNTSLSQQTDETPVVVTVEGEPVIVDGGVKKVLKNNDTVVQPKQVTTKDGVNNGVTVIPAPISSIEQPTVPPATNTGASGGNYEDDDSKEYEESEESEETEIEDESDDYDNETHEHEEDKEDKD